jgi:hypothetical protein
MQYIVAVLCSVLRLPSPVMQADSASEAYHFAFQNRSGLKDPTLHLNAGYQRSLQDQMDPLSAIGLAVNILAFIDFGFKVVSTAKKIHDSGTGVTREDEARQIAATQMQVIASKLVLCPNSQLDAPQMALCQLAGECHTLCQRILALYDKIKPKDAQSKRQSVRAALKRKIYETEKQDLQEALIECRSQLHLQLHWITRFLSP